MKIPKTRDIFLTSWRVLSTTIIVGLGVVILLFGRLETLLPGYADVEVITAKSASSIQAIINDPINAPYKVVVYSLTQIIRDPLLATRATSAIFGSLTLLLFYIFTRKIHSSRIAFLATIIIACSAWFLHTARIGTPDIMLPFALMTFITCGYLLIQDKNRGIISVAAIFALGLSVYVPGMIWFVLMAALIRHKKDISVIIRHFSAPKLIALFVLLITFVVAPIAWAISINPKIILDMLGLNPEKFPTITSYLHDLVSVPLSIIAYTHLNPLMWLGRLPLLDIAASALFILGIYYYFRFRKLDRAKLLSIFMVGASFLVAFNGGVKISVLLPAVYVCIAGGIALLITQWFTVFPFNPLAKSLGVILIASVIIASVTYNIRSYFIAWPNWPLTKTVYTHTDINLIQ